MYAIQGPKEEKKVGRGREGGRGGGGGCLCQRSVLNLEKIDCNGFHLAGLILISFVVNRLLLCNLHTFEASYEKNKTC